jgi:O-acetylhomoserine sulfhydrylase
MTEPYERYHGISFAEEFGPLHLHDGKSRRMRDMGPCLAPSNAWNILHGLETLSLRMEKHCSNALKMVEYLSNHESVAWVSHASAPGHPDKELAEKILPKGTGSMIAFGN